MIAGLIRETSLVRDACAAMDEGAVRRFRIQVDGEMYTVEVEPAGQVPGEGQET